MGVLEFLVLIGILYVGFWIGVSDSAAAVWLRVKIDDAIVSIKSWYRRWKERRTRHGHNDRDQGA